jgi:hypothetical protein
LHPPAPLGYLDGVDVDPVGSKADRLSVDRLTAALSDREWLDDPEAKAARS